MPNNVIPCQQTITLFPADHHSKDDVYSTINRLLALPADCGKNADALYDSLSGMRDPAGLIISGTIPEDMSSIYDTLVQVFQDAGGKVTIR